MLLPSPTSPLSWTWLETPRRTVSRPVNITNAPTPTCGQPDRPPASTPHRIGEVGATALRSLSVSYRPRRRRDQVRHRDAGPEIVASFPTMTRWRAPRAPTTPSSAFAATSTPRSSPSGCASSRPLPVALRPRSTAASWPRMSARECPSSRRHPGHRGSAPRPAGRARRPDVPSLGRACPDRAGRSDHTRVEREQLGITGPPGGDGARGGVAPPVAAIPRPRSARVRRTGRPDGGTHILFACR